MDYLKIILKIIFAILFFQLNSCGLKVIENHGQIYEQNVDFEELQVGKTSKKEIVELLGSPSTTSIFDNEQSWIYISSEFKKFVFLDGSNTVTSVVVVVNDAILDGDGVEQEQLGIDFLTGLLGGTWKQTSYNDNMRVNYAAIGESVYYPELDAFIADCPHASWTLNAETKRWEAPTPDPGSFLMEYDWNESTLSWELTPTE